MMHMPYLEETHGFDCVIRVEREAVENTSGYDDQIIFVDLNTTERGEGITEHWAIPVDA